MAALAGLILKSRLAAYAAAYAAGAAIQKGIGFVLFMWLAHSLSVQSYAAFGLLYALQAGLATFAVAGVVEAVIGLLATTPSPAGRQALFGAAHSVFLLLAIVCAILLAATAHLVSGWIGASGMDLLAVGAAGVLTALYTLRAQLARLDENHLASLVLGLAPALAGLVGGGLLFAVAGTVTSIFTGFALGLVLALPLLRLTRTRPSSLLEGSNQIGSILGRLGPFVLVAALTWLSGYGNTWLVGAIFTPTEVARFTFAYTLSSILHLVATSLNQVWSPRVFKLLVATTIEEVELKNRRFFAVQGLLLGLIGATVLALMPIGLALGGQGFTPYRGLVAELFFLLLAYLLSIPWYHVQNYFYAFSRGVDLMRVSLITSGIGLVLWLACMALIGPLGVYVGFALMMGVRSFGAMLSARRCWSLTVVWQGPVVGSAVLVAGTVAAHYLTLAFG